jgi:hypothetical protein
MVSEVQLVLEVSTVMVSEVSTAMVFRGVNSNGVRGWCQRCQQQQQRCWTLPTTMRVSEVSTAMVLEVLIARVSEVGVGGVNSDGVEVSKVLRESTGGNSRSDHIATQQPQPRTQWEGVSPLG